MRYDILTETAKKFARLYAAVVINRMRFGHFMQPYEANAAISSFIICTTAF
jgi:hypothetical protein